ncbi:hypothetical protein Bhyg_02684, partial [Pseudolycoriella hygida]
LEDTKCGTNNTLLMESMKTPCLATQLIKTLVTPPSGGDSEDLCGGNSWIPYKTEKCFKLVRESTTYHQATQVCSRQDLISTSAIASVTSCAEKLFILENVLDSSIAWVKSPTYDCQQLRSNVSEIESAGCEQENFVLCEKLQSSSKGDAFSIFDSKLQELITRLSEAEAEIKRLSQQLASSTSPPLPATASVPIGFVYTQLPGQGDPYEVWGYQSTWSEITAEYAGLFFRVLGGESGSFNATQEANDHYLKQVTTTHVPHGTRNLSPVALNDEHSRTLVTGKTDSARTTSFGLRFILNEGEVRPKNRAVRIWKRTH